MKVNVITFDMQRDSLVVFLANYKRETFWMLLGQTFNGNIVFDLFAVQIDSKMI